MMWDGRSMWIWGGRRYGGETGGWGGGGGGVLFPPQGAGGEGQHQGPGDAAPTFCEVSTLSRLM